MEKHTGARYLQTFFGKYNQAKNQKMSVCFYSWIFDNFKFDNFILDIESSVMTSYGEQESAKKGYNPAKRSRCSHHSWIAFIDDVKLIGKHPLSVPRPN